MLVTPDGMHIVFIFVPQNTLDVSLVNDEDNLMYSRL